jgi:hypothetical protein
VDPKTGQIKPLDKECVILENGLHIYRKKSIINTIKIISNTIKFVVF